MYNFVIEAPWETYNKKIKALFEKDPDITVGDIYDGDGDTTYAFDIEVNNHEKYVALDRLISGVKEFGNVTVGITLYDEENEVSDILDLYKTLFKGNPIVKEIQTATDPTGTEWDYVLFVPEVVQFPDDDLTDYNGNWNGLAEDIAREFFVDRGVNFCTAQKEQG